MKINSDWMKYITHLKHEFRTDEIQVYHVLHYLENVITHIRPASHLLLFEWIHSIITVTARIATNYSELSEDWIIWIQNGRRISSFIKESLQKQNIIPIGYDRYVLDKIGDVPDKYSYLLNIWTERCYKEVDLTQKEKSLAFMVDIATIRIVLSTNHNQIIVYLGHQHTQAVYNF